MPTNREVLLAGDGTTGPQGGGLPLPEVFGIVLQELLDHGKSTTEQLHTAIYRTAAYKEEFITFKFSSWEKFCDEILAQLNDRDLIDGSQGNWTIGASFESGRKLTVIDDPPIRVKVQPRTERTARENLARRHQDLIAFWGKHTEEERTRQRQDLYEELLATYQWEVENEEDRHLDGLSDRFTAPETDEQQLKSGGKRPSIWKGTPEGGPKERSARYIHDQYPKSVGGTELKAYIQEEAKKLGEIREVGGSINQAINALVRAGLIEKVQESPVKWRWKEDKIQEDRDELERIIKKVKTQPDRKGKAVANDEQHV